MNWKQALAEIETHQFAANLNVASGIRSFFRAVARDPVVVVLRERMRVSGEAREEILGRIYDLAQLDTDLKFENPNDIPLAVSLWLMYFTSFNSGLAAYYVDQAPNCWYAKKLARRLLVPPKSETSDTSGRLDDQQAWFKVSNSIDSMISIKPGSPQDQLRGYFPSTGDETGTGRVKFQAAL